MEAEKTRARKLDHLRICLDLDVEAGTTLLDKVHIWHNPMPELEVSEVDLSTIFAGKRINAPLMITGITGGHPIASKINCMLASVAEELKIALGVGSQRAALLDPSLRYTYRSARECAPSIPLVANIGAVQVAEMGVKAAEEAISMIEADAIAVHLNVGQEVFQPEGDKRFKNILNVISKLVDQIDVPVIVKETGHGLTYNVVYELRGVGVRFFDVSGLGGTNWILVESYRSSNESFSLAAKWMSEWGNPTALAIIEARWAAPDACIIGSGGVRSGLDAVKALALGADIIGVALPALRLLASKGPSGLRDYLKALIESLRAALILTGARSIREFWEKRIAVLDVLRELAEMRGIDLELYYAVRAIRFNRCA